MTKGKKEKVDIDSELEKSAAKFQSITDKIDEGKKDNSGVVKLIDRFLEEANKINKES